MLEIIVHTASGGRESLELNPAATLQMDMTSPFFDTELSQGTFSYPVDIPFSERNRRILGSPEMLETISSSEPPWWIVDVHDDRIPELVSVKLTLLSHTGDYQYRRGSYTMTVSGPESIFGSRIKGRTLKNLNYGNNISLGTLTARQWAKRVMEGQLPQYSMISFAPVYWPGFIDEGRDDLTNEIVAYDIINRVVYHPMLPGGWEFGQPGAGAVVAPPGTDEYVAHRTVPFLNMFFVLKAVFADAGFTLSGTFLEDADYACLTIPNNQAMEIYGSNLSDINRALMWRDCVPDIAIADFLQAVQDAFGIAFVFGADYKVQVSYRDDALRSKKIVNITANTTDTYTAEKPDIATGGLKMQWANDSSDKLQSDWVKTLDLTRVRTRVAYMLELNTLSLTPAAAVGDLVYVDNENAWYEYFAGGVWRLLSISQEPKEIGGAEKIFEVAIAPLLTQIQVDPFYGVPYMQDMCAISVPGTYYNSKLIKVENPMALRMCYIKNYTVSYPNPANPFATLTALNVPVSFVHSIYPTKTAVGNRRVKTSLCWNRADGLYDRHHRRWINAQLDGWYVKAKHELKAIHREEIDYGSILQIKNVQYLLVQKKPVIGSNAAVETKLLKI